jgi:hypothetical protein
MHSIRHLTVIQCLLFGFQLFAPGFKHDNSKLGSSKLQRERYPRGACADDAQITLQLCIGRDRPTVGYHPVRPNGVCRFGPHGAHLARKRAFS